MLKENRKKKHDEKKKMSVTCLVHAYLLYAYLPVNNAIALQQNTSNKLVLILFLK